MRIAVPPGIGDSLWAMTKVPALLAQAKETYADIFVCESSLPRSKEFLERFDFVRSVEYCEWSCVEAEEVNEDGTVSYAATGQNWHDEFDWILVPNATLERGERLETWQPQWTTDFDVMNRWHFTTQEIRRATEVQRKLGGSYCVMYAGSITGNTHYGHNRHGRWTPQDWCRLAEAVRSEMRRAVVLVGADWDRGFSDGYLQPAGFWADADMVGKLSICDTMAVIALADFGVFYQSGLGIAASYMGVPAAMWWGRHGESIHPTKYMTFDERMATAWVKPSVLAASEYLPLIYGRESPAEIVDMLKRVI